MTSVYAEHEASMAWQAIPCTSAAGPPGVAVEHGGCDWTLPQHYIFSRECQLAGAPEPLPMGIRMVSHAIMKFGTKEQKDFFPARHSPARCSSLGATRSPSLAPTSPPQRWPPSRTAAISS